MHRLNLAALAMGLLLATAGVAEAKQWKYAGMHPRTGQPDGGLCHIQVVHVHAAAPTYGDVLYRLHDGVYVFIGDPTPFGYDGPRYAYYGHHPVALDVLVEDDGDEDVEYCYHDGPHYHAYEPPPQQRFVEKEEVYYYTGDYPTEYVRERPALVRVNTVYRTWRHPAPVVHAAPPPEYHGPVVQVSVGVPLPHVEVTVGTVPVHRDVVIVEQPVVEERYIHTKHKKFKGKKHHGWKD